ncbi:hypothetical protein [Trichocoleus sp. FACHB-262]|uniref:hypothetical protein n=1 Tax=Trichocoleus sp. FACHB-262 TaxID=2692869 RepID=UPI0018F03A6E|nr:hypothetical protein [Trichocoleus sp. FACHB-262]
MTYSVGASVRLLRLCMGASLAIALAGCETLTTSQYEATARTTYTWRVEYSTNPGRDQATRTEAFAATSLLNRNGNRPEGAVTGPDDRGLWWPALPPRPTVDKMEQRQRTYEKISTPQILKTVEYEITYQSGDRATTASTNHDVYRTVVKALPNNTSLELTLGVDERSVTKAEPR